MGDSRGGRTEPCEQVSEVDGIQHREGEETLLGRCGRNVGTEVEEGEEKLARGRSFQ